jgi:putative ABC transport system permease protein
MFRNYLKIALRNLRRNKGYSLLNVLGLALSVGCCILIFALVKYHLSFDNFHQDKERIYRFVTEQHRDNISYVPSVPPAFGQAFRRDYVYGEAVVRIVRPGDQLITFTSKSGTRKFKETRIAYVEPTFFGLFNFPMKTGNAQKILSQANNVILSESTARKYFGDENPLNKIIRINGLFDCIVAGVIYDLPVNTDQRADIFVSWPTVKSFDSFLSDDESWSGIGSDLECYVKLRPGVNPKEVEMVLPAYVKRYRPTNKNVHHYKLQPLNQVHFDARYRGVMQKRNIWILGFTGLFLLVTACVNFINLSTAQAARRAREVGVRKVLGGRRVQLFWQFIAETGLITLVATLLAVVVASVALPYVNQLFHTSITLAPSKNWQLLVFVPLLIVLVTFTAGSYPGLLLSGFQPVIAIKSKVNIQSIGGFNIRRALIVMQFTISLLLIICMLVITRQMHFARQSDLGFAKDAVVMIPLGADTVGTKEHTVQNRIAAVVGVQNVSMCYTAPSSQLNRFSSVRFDNRADEEAFRVSFKPADDQYITTFGLKLIAGRNIFASDTVRELLVNEAMIRKLQLSNPSEAIGKKLSYGGDRYATIVGVVRDFHDRSFYEDISPVVLCSNAQQYTTYAVRIDAKRMTNVLPALEKVWSNAYPDRIYEHQFLDARIAEFYETEDTMLKIITVFSFIAIFIGCLGLYGLVTYMVAQKTKEIGIRKVLGSGVTEIVWIFGKEFSILISFAFLIAAPVAWWLMSQWLQDFEFHIPLGPGVFIISILTTFTIAALTIGYQTITAALTNPVKSLRTE